MWTLGVPWWELVIRSAGIYLALLVVLRLFGKREVGQFTLFDLVLILLIANAVQPAIGRIVGSSGSCRLIVAASDAGSASWNGIIGLRRRRRAAVQRIAFPWPWLWNVAPAGQYCRACR